MDETKRPWPRQEAPFGVAASVRFATRANICRRRKEPYAEADPTRELGRPLAAEAKTLRPAGIGWGDFGTDGKRKGGFRRGNGGGLRAKVERGNTANPPGRL
jgi:hypothetical protein